MKLVDQRVTPVLHYDPLGRLIQTDFPDGTFSTVTFTPWRQETRDQNDNVEASDWGEIWVRSGDGGESVKVR